jgi:hypothetical protein
MQFLIWFVGIFILALWSATVWLGHAATALVLTLPWDQALASLRQLEMPALLRPFLEPFLGSAWQAWVEALAPLLQWTGSLVQGSSAWLVSALPVLAWLIWGMGSLLLLLLVAGASFALWFARRKTAGAGASSLPSASSLRDWVDKLRGAKRYMPR